MRRYAVLVPMIVGAPSARDQVASSLRLKQRVAKGGLDTERGAEHGQVDLVGFARQTLVREAADFDEGAPERGRRVDAHADLARDQQRVKPALLQHRNHGVDLPQYLVDRQLTKQQ